MTREQALEKALRMSLDALMLQPKGGVSQWQINDAASRRNAKRAARVALAMPAAA